MTDIPQNSIRALPGHRPPATGEPVPEVIGVLENLLEHAKAGRLQSFIGVGWMSDGDRISAWADLNPDVYQTMGGLVWLQHEYAYRKSEKQP